MIFSCSSTVSDNFDEALRYYPELSLEKHLIFGNTTLTQTTDISNRYKYSYIVNYKDYKMGQIDFGQLGRLWNDRIKFSTDNPVFYNNTQPYLSDVMKDLNLKVENFTNIDIAIDSYNFNSEQVLRRNLKNKENQVRLFHTIIRDRTETIDGITYFNKGSLNNPYKVRSISIKDKNKTKEYFVYDKLEEIDYSGKDYILEFHKTKNQKMKNLYRAEVRLEYDAIRYYWHEVLKRPITLEDLLDKEFLYSMFTYHLKTAISIKDAKKKEIPLFPCPF
ncbi:MAG: hypothetical protein LBH46_00235 [Rickettsiales bacterium]|nr:hypothetical protein [Rickettsiales bacterium]